MNKKKLVIVESPAKAKTIGKFLGRNYVIKASVGHIRDLPKSKIGIDIDEDFEPKYINIRGKGDVIKELKKEAKKASKVYLATDPDREGEAISWHLAHILKMDLEEENRIVFNEITKTAIKDAVKKPRAIDTNLVDAQQARRLLDRLVGYQISPLLWRKIDRGLSAGRVQSVALKLICDKEKEVQSFVPEEYWSIEANVLKGRKKIETKFVGNYDNKGKLKTIKLNNEEDTQKILEQLNRDEFTVEDIKKKEIKKSPGAPFTTSSMQQDAYRKINYSSRKTMQIAQQLYEGINIKGTGSVGLISYIRTDSFRISDEARGNVEEYIKDNVGEKYYKSRDFSKKNKANSQDAHEAIRPTDINRTPQSIKESLSADQFKLYNLIWRRFVASQMSDAIYDNSTILFNSNDYIFRSSGSILRFDGYKKIYNFKDKSSDVIFPNMEKGEILKVKELLPNQHFTNPPARYSEATLIKSLEVLGIGRPSTYAPTISTIVKREYVFIENKHLQPTEMGFLVNDLVLKYFHNVVNEEFTANLEDRLDDVANGDLFWKEIIREFYVEFKDSLDIADKEIEKIEIKPEVSDELCPNCGKNLIVKKSRYGKFLACPSYPECKYTKSINEKFEPQETDKVCELCGSKMLLRKGRYGEFLACSNYPECKNTQQILNKIGIKCPKCGKELVVKFTKKGKRFYGCEAYPACDFVSWYEPVEEKCPKCGDLMIKKKDKIVCSKCGEELK